MPSPGTCEGTLQIAAAIVSFCLICVVEMSFPTQDKLPGAFVALKGRNKEDVNSE